jgi:hypothetical protein
MLIWIRIKEGKKYSQKIENSNEIHILKGWRFFLERLRLLLQLGLPS